MREMTRGDFLKGGLAAGAVALVAGVGLAGCSSDASKGEGGSSGAEGWDHETDIVIVGAGIGGLTAALKAQQDGAKTIVVEVNTWTGGGSAYCGGVLQCSGTSIEAYDANTGYMNDPELSHAYAQTFYDGLPDWFSDMGAVLNNPGKEGGYFCQLGDDPAATLYGCRPFFDSLEEIYVEEGGTILFETQAEHIMTEGEYDKTVTGLYCKDAEGNVVRIKARAVILACGGFQNNTELCTRYLGQYGSYAGLMGTPWNTGSGMAMAQEVGASLQGKFNEFAACMASAWPAKNPQTDPVEFKTRHFDDNGPDSIYFLADSRVDSPPARAIIVNNEGKRFVDEAGGDNVHRIPLETIKQPFATGFYIFDSAAWDSFMNKEDDLWRCVSRFNKEQFDEVILSDQIGAVVYQGDTIEELCDAMNASGVYNHRISKPGLLETIAEYNEAAETKDENLVPHRGYGDGSLFDGMQFEPLSEGPFYCWPARPYIYQTYGGVAVNTGCQVLDASRNPIPGLYAAAPTAGGFMGYNYTGSMACAASTGYMAATTAVAQLA